MKMARALVACGTWLALTAPFAWSAPPQGTDLNSPLHQWYEGLKQPESGASCCSLADCRPVDAVKQDEKGYQIYYQGTWMRVPPEKVIHGTPNEAGEPVACIMYLSGNPTILCFLPASQT